MPQRFLKPGLTTSRRFSLVSFSARLLFIQLVTLVDDYGRYDADPITLAHLVFPFDSVTGEQIDSWLAELENARLRPNEDALLTRYQVNGSPYLVLHRWIERVRSAGSRYPEPPFVQTLHFYSKQLEETYLRRHIELGHLPANADACAHPSTPSVNGQQMTADVDGCQQMVASPSPSSDPPSAPAPDPLRGGRRMGSNSSPTASKAQWAALDAVVKRLKKIPDEDRTEAQDAELKQKQRWLRKLQKKQGAGDFRLLTEEDMK